MSRTVDQFRVEAAIQFWKSDYRLDKKRLSALIEGSPALVRRSGLLQALAIWKKSDEGSVLGGALIDWLKAEPSPVRDHALAFNSWRPRSVGLTSFIEWLAKSDRTTCRLIEQEVMQYLATLKLVAPDSPSSNRN